MAETNFKWALINATCGSTQGNEEFTKQKISNKEFLGYHKGFTEFEHSLEQDRPMFKVSLNIAHSKTDLS